MRCQIRSLSRFAADLLRLAGLPSVGPRISHLDVKVRSSSRQRADAGPHSHQLDALSRRRAERGHPLRSSRVARRYREKTVKQGPATSVLLATSPLLHRVGGRYFDCNAALAVDPEAAARLWQVSIDTPGN